MLRRILFFVLWALNMLGPSLASADVTLTFSGSLTTKDGTMEYEVHTPKKHLSFAKKVQQVLVDDAKPLLEYFGWVPRDRVHFIVRTTKQANGSATVFPFNIINLYNFPPFAKGPLSGGRDWIKVLVIHELTHIIHMDRTTGFLRGLTAIFGSIGKLGGVVPRWFAEGIATWAETTFTGEGRLRDPRYFRSFAQVFLRKNSCRTIDCLDAPKHFPYQSYAYWAGTYFIDYLERKKSGTVRCLVERNSNTLPFFLNSAFKKCTGTTAQDQFAKFIDELEDSQKEKSDVAKNYGLKPLGRVLGTINWSKGTVLDGDYFYFVKSYRRRQYVGRLNLATLPGKFKRSFRGPNFTKLWFLLRKIQSVVAMPCRSHAT